MNRTDGCPGGDEPKRSLDRRDFLTKAAAAGAIAWTAPVILSRPGWAADAAGGTPKCRPDISIRCVRYFCTQGQKFFPGIEITTGTCPCAPGTAPVACVKIANLTDDAPGTIATAYRQGTDCSPGGEDRIVSTGNWECISGGNYTIFFGDRRAGQGAIPDIPNGAVISFLLGVWARCPDQDATAFTCETYSVSLTWDNANNVVSQCNISDNASVNLCTDPSPCPTC